MKAKERAEAAPENVRVDEDVLLVAVNRDRVSTEIQAVLLMFLEALSSPDHLVAVDVTIVVVGNPVVLAITILRKNFELLSLFLLHFYHGKPYQ